MTRPQTLGELRGSEYSEARLLSRSVKDEMRENLICKLKRDQPIFPGIIGYEDTVLPQLVNAILSRHNFILLGLRGQAKSRLLRGLTLLLDDFIPAVAGCEINDNPYQPICRTCRTKLDEMGDAIPLVWLGRDERYVEKLATPDVTIADMIGDIDPIKAARAGHQISDELTIHYGLLPRANRGIFAINELPDLAGKIQVGLFNIMQEGDVQIKGYPIRMALDVCLVFSANPEDYTARGKIITPLKDRIGSEIRTHYPATVEQGIAITAQEAYTERDGIPVQIPQYIREIVEEIAFLARGEKKIDQRSGVSQRMSITCLENVLSNAERRAIRSREQKIVPRVADILAALPALTGKFELEYEGELKGADHVARELIRASVGKVYSRYFEGQSVQQVIQWFDLGGTLKVPENANSRQTIEQLQNIQGLMDRVQALGIRPNEDPAAAVSAAEFLLEGLYAHRRISRTEERGYAAEEKKREPPVRDDLMTRYRKPLN